MTSTIATEAASPSDAVLLATHTPLRIRSRGDGDAGDFITEREFIDAFLNGPVKEGVLVAPVVGESGSGKSHLVRWVYASLEANPLRHVIYLPKAQTSLRDVIERLLRDLPGSQFDEVRSKLGGLSEAVSRETLERKILDELAAAVRDVQVERGDFLTKALVGDRGLYVLLHDPLFREYLLRPESFIPRRAEHALRGRGVDEDDVPPVFTVDDLPLEIANVNNASDLARAAFRKVSADSQMQVAAVKLLNDHLDVAVMRAANLGVGSIQAAFMALREHLVGQEIVLLIEDFALIQGIRRDLLDAIIEVGTVGGIEKYAPVRTMMAVTHGYYSSLPDTFRTRAEASSPVYVVDVDMADVSEGTDRTAVNFVARYLNAARLGAKALEDSAPTTPNACERCPLLDACHAAFGASDDGYGLYPYNESALRRAVAITADPERKSMFNPRRVLARMVRGVLTEEASAIRDGRFPTANFLREERARDREQTAARRQRDLPLAELSALDERYNEPERTRYLLTFQFWGGVSFNVRPDVLSAFSLPPADLQFDEGTTARPPSIENEIQQRPQAATIPPALQRQLEDVDNWARGGQLSQETARTIRTVVRRALVADISWVDPIMKAPLGPVLSRAVPDAGQISRSVSIAGARENLAQGISPILRFEQTPANGLLFKSLLHFQVAPSSAPDALIELRRISDECRSDVIARVVASMEYERTQLIVAAASLIAGAALLGQLALKPRVRDFVGAALWSGDHYVRADNSRSDQWLQTEAKYLADRKTAVVAFRAAVGASQGGGAVHAVDDPRVRDIVTAAAKLVDSFAVDETPSWAREAEQSRLRLVAVIDRQLSEWDAAVNVIRGEVPEGVSYLGTVDAVKAATEMGTNQGFVRANLVEVESANVAARARDFSSVTQLESAIELARASDGLDRWSVVGRAVGDEAVAIAKYLRDTAVWLDAGLRNAEGRDLAGTLDIDADIETVLSKWGDIVTAGEEANGE
ncbi:ATP-binding protein [Leifsonia flava]|uniref:ATP-binding protein n=1 Tax=Orlajensenia leifsoniae TaxID=2561933 RepID=A0A4Y9QUL4_9MICO|nr:ATP-binding protein [Leifsonia flava]